VAISHTIFLLRDLCSVYYALKTAVRDYLRQYKQHVLVLSQMHVVMGAAIEALNFSSKARISQTLPLAVV